LDHWRPEREISPDRQPKDGTVRFTTQDHYLAQVGWPTFIPEASIDEPPCKPLNLPVAKRRSDVPILPVGQKAVKPLLT